MRYPADKPCPRPGEMEIVNTVEGSFWRTIRDKAEAAANMNDVMKANTRLTTLLSPAASRFTREIRPYLNGLKTRRITIRVKQCLHHSIVETGELNYKYFEDLNFQPEYPLWKLMKHVPKLAQDENDVVLKIPIPRGGAVNALNSLITGYRLVLIMVVGDPIKGETLSTYEKISPFYESGKSLTGGCELRLTRPDAGEHWVCMLRIVSYEDSSVAQHPRHAGMKVVGWG